VNETAKAITIGILKALGVIVGISLLLWFIFKIQALILFIAIAAVISLIGRPVVLFLKQRLRFNNTMASLVTLLLLIASVSVVLRIFTPIVIEQSKNISEINFDMVKKDLNELNIQASDYIGVEKINLIEAIKKSQHVRNFDFEIIPAFVDKFFLHIGAFIVGLFSVFFLAFFFLKDERLIINSVTIFANPGKEERFLRVLTTVRSLLSRYFLGLTLQVMIVTLFYSVLLLFLDITNAIAIAIICAVLNIVPYLGPLVAMLLMLLVVISNNLGADFSTELLPLMLITIGGHLVTQLFDNIISQPVIFGKSVRSHPLEIFLVILIGGYLFGVIGMILAVPGYTTLKVISKEFLSEFKIVKRLTRNL
jgi:predicted PurR-regulated permease PerM